MSVSTEPTDAQQRFDAIPAELRELKGWLLWRLEESGVGSRPTKVPYQTTYGFRGKLEEAKTNEPKTWSSFDDTVKALEAHPDLFNGIGLVLHPSFNTWGLDVDPLDKRRDALEFPEVASLVAGCASYVERSVSGSGVHCIMRLAEGEKLPFLENRKSLAREGFRVEPFRQGYFTMTGRRLPDASNRVLSCPGTLKYVGGLLAEKRERSCPVGNPDKAKSLHRSDVEVLEGMYRSPTKGQTLRDLYLGSPLHYTSLSERDFRLIDELGYATDWNFDAIERLARASGCARRKWDSPRGPASWLRASIEKAYAGRRSNGRSSSRRATTGGVPGPSASSTPGSTGAKASASPLTVLDSDQFFAIVHRREWLIKNVLLAGRCQLVAGSQKTFKSLTTLDAAISAASGTDYLGKPEFGCPKPVRTFFLSAELGGPILQSSAVEICRSKGIDPLSLKGKLFWCEDAPNLTLEDARDRVVDAILNRGVEYAVFDPAYLLLRGEGVDYASLFAVGGMLQNLNQIASRAGCTLCLIHHCSRGATRANQWKPPTLDSVAAAGFPEWSHQWSLLGHRAPYCHGEAARLWLVVGGRDGHGGEFAVDVDAGVLDENFNGRKWEVRFPHPTARRATSASASASAPPPPPYRADVVEQFVEAENDFGRQPTQADILRHLGIKNKDTVRAILEWLLNNGRIKKVGSRFVKIKHDQ